MYSSHSGKRFNSTMPARFTLSLLVLSIHAAYAADAVAPMADNDPAMDTAAVVQVHSSAPTASSGAPSQGSLDARSAQSQVSNDFVRDYISPIADFSQVIQMTPSLYSYSPNGVGLGDTATNFRGFSEGNYNVTFDGIPFQDTNGVSHTRGYSSPACSSAAPSSTAAPARPPSSAWPRSTAPSTCCRGPWKRKPATPPARP